MSVNIAETVNKTAEWFGDARVGDAESVGMKMTQDARNNAKNTRMTWRDRQNYRSPWGFPVGRGKTSAGEFDSNLPYIGPLAGWRVQNLAYYNPSGVPTPLEQIPEFCEWRKEKNFELRKNLMIAMAAYVKQAQISDQLLCRVCMSYSAIDAMDFARHLRKKHPAEFDAEMERLDALEENEAPVLPPMSPAQPNIGSEQQPRKPEGRPNRESRSFNNQLAGR